MALAWATVAQLSLGEVLTDCHRLIRGWRRNSSPSRGRSGGSAKGSASPLSDERLSARKNARKEWSRNPCIHFSYCSHALTNFASLAPLSLCVLRTDNHSRIPNEYLVE